MVTVTAPCLLAATNNSTPLLFFISFFCQNRDQYVTARLKEVNDRLIDCGFGRVEWNVPSRAETGLTYGDCQKQEPVASRMLFSGISGIAKNDI